MKLDAGLALALRRKRGELNISVMELARQTGVSRWTLDRLLSGERDRVRPSTVNKLNAWLYQQI